MYFWKKWQKTVSGGQVPLEGTGAFYDEDEYNLFYGNEVSNSSSYKNFSKIV